MANCSQKINLPTENDIDCNRLEGESNICFDAYVLFRDAGKTRKQADIARKLNKSPSLVNRWARLYRWKERVSIWDQRVNAVATRQKLMDRQAARIKASRIANKMQDLGEGQIDKHIELAEKADGPTMEADKGSKIAAEGIKIRRLLDGDPTEINENRNTDIDWSRLEAEEIKIFKALVVKLKGESDD